MSPLDPMNPSNPLVYRIIISAEETGEEVSGELLGGHEPGTCVDPSASLCRIPV